MLKSILTIGLLLLANSAYADDLTIRVSGKAEYNGQEIVRLRAQANQQLQAMGEDLEDYELVGVTLFAKSRAGNGRATLIIGQDQQTRNVPRAGNNGLFYLVEAPWSYHRIQWDVRDVPGTDQERWQMRFNGNIKVHHIELRLAAVSERIRIPLKNEIITNSVTLTLRQLLNEQGVNVQGRQLKKVILVAKSHGGRATAQLRIGQEVSIHRPIQAAPAGFNFQDITPESYNRIRWDLIGQTQGPWQVFINGGRVKLKAVIVELQ